MRSHVDDHHGVGDDDVVGGDGVVDDDGGDDGVGGDDVGDDDVGGDG